MLVKILSAVDRALRESIEVLILKAKMPVGELEEGRS